MNAEKITFSNASGQPLVGRLELPADRHPHNYALFAHCFTCSKNLLAAKSISRALTAQGFGVLRFDFTGLGESEGDFADTNFSGNVADLVSAANFLATNYASPTLLVGHSLGGAAVIFAAAAIASVEAIATLGAPATPQHVKHLLSSKLEDIESSGKAVVTLSGRDFTIKKQFLDDLEHQQLPTTLKKLRKPLLILHAPQDDTVGIQNAEELYKAAHHPKSFVSLDGADHLLTNKADAHYAGGVIAGWAKRYVTIKERVNPDLKSTHDVVASLDKDHDFTTHLKVGRHYMLADEPESFGGNDFGPSPYELVSAGLAACTVMTLQLYAKRKGWPLESVVVHTSYSKTHAQDCENCEDSQAKIDTFHRELQLNGPLDEVQQKRLLEIADKCPVHKTLHSETQVITTLRS
ncbi:MAG: bifunctional alpha/beta hydrolase/OsmC family protein [Bacteroidota bacterium]